MSEQILVLSDTHGRLEPALSYIKGHAGLDRILHLGDHAWDAEELQEKTGRVVLGVRGNNDWGATAPADRLFKIEGHTLYLVHGHRLGVYGGPQGVVRAAIERGADMVLYGHTHLFFFEKIGGVWALNPGSPSLPRDGKPGCALLTLAADSDPSVEHVLF